MNFDDAPTNYIEHKIGFDHKNPIPKLLKIWISRNSAKVRIGLKLANPSVEFFDEGEGSRWAICGNPIVNRKQVALSSRKIPDGALSRHVCAVAASSSSVRG